MLKAHTKEGSCYDRFAKWLKAKLLWLLAHSESMLTKARILISCYQLLGQFGGLFDIPYPPFCTPQRSSIPSLAFVTSQVGLPSALHCHSRACGARPMLDPADTNTLGSVSRNLDILTLPTFFPNIECMFTSMDYRHRLVSTTVMPMACIAILVAISRLGTRIGTSLRISSRPLDAQRGLLLCSALGRSPACQSRPPPSLPPVCRNSRRARDHASRRREVSKSHRCLDDRQRPQPQRPPLARLVRRRRLVPRTPQLLRPPPPPSLARRLDPRLVGAAVGHRHALHQHAGRLGALLLRRATRRVACT